MKEVRLRNLRHGLGWNVLKFLPILDFVDWTGNVDSLKTASALTNLVFFPEPLRRRYKGIRPYD